MTDVEATRAPLDRHLALAALEGERFVDAVYRLLLRRLPEEDVRSELAGRLRDGTLSHAALARDVARSREFERLREIDDAVAAALAAPAADPDERFLDEAYGLLLRRPPDAQARTHVLDDLRSHRTSRAAVLASVLTSDEFDHVFTVDDAIAGALAYGRMGGRLRELTAPADRDERTIEMPWALSRYRGERCVLDVGYANAEPAWIAALVSLAPERLVGVDLADVDVPGMETVVADVRDLPFEDSGFDVVFCISTLEHVGRDNEVYGVDAPRDHEPIGPALRELRRVLAPDGRVLLTVPAGAPENHGWFVQLEPLDWRRRFKAAGFVVAEEETYVRDEAGWRAGDPGRAAYGVRRRGASGVLCVELRRA